jgi:hypothetical protein
MCIRGCKWWSTGPVASTCKAYRTQMKTPTGYLLVCSTLSRPDVPLFSNGEFRTLSFRQRYPRFDSLANEKDICEAGFAPMSFDFELKKVKPTALQMVQRILHVHNIKTPNVLFSVHNYASSAHIPSTNNNYNVTSIELDIVCDFAILPVEFHSVVDADEGFWDRIIPPSCVTMWGHPWLQWRLCGL